MPARCRAKRLCGRDKVLVERAEVLEDCQEMSLYEESMTLKHIWASGQTNL